MTISCKSSKGAGYCRSVAHNGCPGGTFDPANLCPGSQDIQCCVKGAGTAPPPTSYGSCTSKGRSGTCKSVSKQGCSGGTFDPADLCPGSQDIQCCLPGSSAPPTSYGTCTSKGRAGTCKSVSEQGCAGGSFDPANLCPGSQDIQCMAASASCFNIWKTLMKALAGCVPKSTNAPAPAPPAPTPAPPSPCTPAAADNLIFNTPIADFDRDWDAKSPSCFDWSSDDCSGSPDNPLGFDFNYPCRRHDFGYRNSKKMHRCTDEYKKRVDDNFQHDLYNYCSQFSGWSSWRGVECRRLADVYHEAVRKLGSC